MQNGIANGLISKLTYILFIFNFSIQAQALPVGFIEQYTNPCNNESLFNTFIRSDSGLWKINSDASLKIIPTNETATHSSIGVLDKMIFGEYIMEFDFQIDNTSGDSSSFSFLGNIKSKDSYYIYSFSADSIKFYLMYKGNKSLLDKEPIKKLKPGWNKAHIEWDILSRNATIVVNNNQANKLTFNDNKLVMGYLGFSNGNFATCIKNIKIWAPTCITDKSFIW
jgi:hypothetical protein